MVRAILEGRKTVTRRVIKAPYYIDEKVLSPESGLCLRRGTNITGGMPYADSPYHPGDILYVRETFKIDYLSNIPGSGRIFYKADGAYSDFSFSPARYDMMRRAQLKPGWRPNENMPREAARIFLRVTEVRVERLRGSFFQCGPTIIQLQKEGVDIGEQCRECIEAYGSPCCLDSESECGMLDEVRSSFSDLWDSTIRPGIRALYGWGGNPWVWVIEFERYEKSEAAP